jgi:hypothetical protein
MVRLFELKDFKALEGHCRVPRTHTTFPGLAAWVSGQRLRLRRGTLPPDRFVGRFVGRFCKGDGDRSRLRQRGWQTLPPGACRVG